MADVAFNEDTGEAVRFDASQNKWIPTQVAVHDDGIKRMGWDGSSWVSLPDAKQEPGALGRLARGAKRQAESLISSAQTAYESLTDEDKEAIAKRSEERQKKIAKEYGPERGLAEVEKAYKEKGLLSAAGEVLYQAPEAIGSLAPTMAGGVVGGLLGGPAGAAIGMGGTSFLAQYGSNLERQFEVQAEKGQPINPDQGAAAIGALAQAGLDTAGFMIPFGKAIIAPFSKVAAKGGTAAAEKLAAESITKTLAKGTAVGMIAEVPTEVAQQMIERYQAGLDLFTDDALKEYGDIAYKTAISVAPLGGAGRMIEKGGAKREIAREKEDEAAAAALAEEQKRYLAERGTEAEQADVARQAQEKAEAEEAVSAVKPMLALPAPPEEGGPARDIIGRGRDRTERFAGEQDVEAMLKSKKLPLEPTIAEQRGDQFVVSTEGGNPIQGGFRTLEEAQSASDRFNAKVDDYNAAQQEEEKKKSLGEYVRLANQISRAGSVPIYFGDMNTGLAAKIFNARMNRQGEVNVLETNAPFTTPQEIQALELNADRDLTIVQNSKNGRVELKSGEPKPDELNLSDRLLQAQEPGIDVAAGLTIPQRETVAEPAPQKQKPAITPAAESYLDSVQDRTDPTKFTPKNTEKVTNQLKSIAIKNDIDLKKTITKNGVETKVDKTPQDIVDELVQKRDRQVKLAGVAREAPKEQFGPQPRPPRTAEQIGFEKAQRADQIKSQIKSSFDKLGLTKQGVTPNVVSYIADESGKPTRGAAAIAGEFDPATKTITLASDIYDPSLSAEQLTSKIMETVNHEVVHALKQAGLFKQNEWNLLENYVKRGEGRKFLERAKIQYPDLDVNGQVEEAIAEAAREFDAGKFNPVGAPRSLLKRIVDFFKGLFGAAKAANAAPDQIFNAIRTGEVGAREGTIQAGTKSQSRLGLSKEEVGAPISLKLTNPEEVIQSENIDKEIAKINEHLSSITAKEGLKISKTYMDYIKEFFNPYHMLGKGADTFRIARALMSGDIAKITERVNQLVGDISAAKEDKFNISRYLTTKDADPFTIKNEKARKAAVETKNLINQIGDELVKRKLITSSEREALRDQYLPRVYLAYAGKKKFVTGGHKPGFMYYLRSREDLTPEQRASLGEIEDPAFLVQEALFAPMRDLSILNYFKKLNALGNGTWILGMDNVKYKTRSGIELQLSLPELKTFASNLDRQLSNGEIAPDRTAQAVEDINDMRKFISQKERELAANVDEGRYIQMPKDEERYGGLAGLWVAKPIYRDIMGVGSFLPNNMSGLAAIFADGTLMSKATSWFKVAKVVSNPPTIATNIISNTLMMHMADVGMHRILPNIGAAFKEIVIDKKGKYYDIAHRYGLKETTLSEAELKSLYKQLELRKTGGSDLNKIVNMFRALGDAMGHGKDRASAFYGGIETVFKTAIIKDAMEHQGLTEEQAVLKANKYLFDYSEVHDSIKVLRNMPFGAPFITWSYKMTPLLIETALTKPWKFWPYAAMYYGLSAMASAAISQAGGSDEDKEKLKKYISKKTAESPFVLVTSPTDVVDFGKFLPFTNMYKFAKGVSKGDPVEALKSFGFFGGPVADIGTFLITGKDPFTGRDVVPKGSTPAEKAVIISNHLAGVFMPPFMKDLPQLAVGAAIGDPELVAQSSSLVADSLKKAFEGPSGKAAGLPTKSAADLTKNFFGINTYHPSLEQFRRNFLSMQKEMNEATSAMNAALKDPELSQAERKKIIDKYVEIKKEKAKEMAEYFKNSNLSPSILKAVQDSVTR